MHDSLLNSVVNTPRALDSPLLKLQNELARNIARQLLSESDAFFINFSLGMILPIIFLLSSFEARPIRAQTLKIATRAPEGSGWTEALHRINKRIKKATNDSVQLKVYAAGGIQGDEPVVIRKMRIGTYRVEDLPAPV